MVDQDIDRAVENTVTEFAENYKVAPDEVHKRKTDIYCYDFLDYIIKDVVKDESRMQEYKKLYEQKKKVS